MSPAAEREAILRLVRDARWHARLAATTTDDELMKHAWSYLLSSLARGWPNTIEERDATRRRIAEALIRAGN